MEFARTSDVDEAEYERFLDSFAAQPGAALAYHYPFYLRFLADVAYPGSALRFVTARDAGGCLAGVVPALHVQTERVNVWLSLAYFGPNAGALVRSADTSEGTAAVCTLIRTAATDARDRDCGSMTMYTPLGAATEPYVAGLGGVDFDLRRLSQWLTIPADPDTSPWPAKVRYYARRAAANGLTVREVADESELDSLWDLYRARCDERAIPVKPREHVRALFRTAGERGVFLVAERDGHIVAGLICFLGGGVISYYLPCASGEARSLRPGLLLLDRAVAIGRARGCRLLNFEASPSAGDPVYQFKAECGGQPVPFHVLVKLLREGALDEYRALTPVGVGREVPHAFVVPFNALT